MCSSARRTRRTPTPGSSRRRRGVHPRESRRLDPAPRAATPASRRQAAPPARFAASARSDSTSLLSAEREHGLRRGTSAPASGSSSETPGDSASQGSAVSRDRSHCGWRIHGPVLALESAVEEIAGVELHAGLGGRDFERATGRRLDDTGRGLPAPHRFDSAPSCDRNHFRSSTADSPASMRAPIAVGFRKSNGVAVHRRELAGRNRAWGPPACNGPHSASTRARGCRPSPARLKYVCCVRFTGVDLSVVAWYFTTSSFLSVSV